MSDTVFVFGGKGTLGGEIASSLASSFDVAITTREKANLDPANFEFDFHNPIFGAGLLAMMRKSSSIVISAAVPGDGLLLSMSEEKIREAIAINLATPLLIVKSYLRERLSVGLGGRVVVISSIAASSGLKGLSVYGATKSGLEAAVASLAREMGPRGFDFYAVAPGFFPSNLSSGLSQDQLLSIKRRTPAGQLVSPEEIAAVVVQICQGFLSPLSGRTLTLDYGATL